MYKAPTLFHWFHKTLLLSTFYVLLVKILHLEKKHVMCTPVYLSLLFQEKINWRGIDWKRDGREVKRLECVCVGVCLPLSLSLCVCGFWISTENRTKVKKIFDWNYRNASSYIKTPFNFLSTLALIENKRKRTWEGG